MIFKTRINGIPCQCNVIEYSAPQPMLITGSGMGDCIAPDPGEFYFVLLDRKGYRARWLDQYITSDVEDRLYSEFQERLNSFDYSEVA